MFSPTPCSSYLLHLEWPHPCSNMPGPGSSFKGRSCYGLSRVLCGINSRICAQARYCDLFLDPLDSLILPAYCACADNGGACRNKISHRYRLFIIRGKNAGTRSLAGQGCARGSAPSIPGLLQKSLPGCCVQ